MSGDDRMDKPGHPGAYGFGVWRWWVVNGLTLLVPGLAIAGLVLSPRDSDGLVWTAVAAGVDAIDGVLARRWGVTSTFGRRLDLIGDLVAFVFCPALLLVLLGSGGWTTLVLVLGGAGRVTWCWGRPPGAEVFRGVAFPAAGLAVVASLALGCSGVVSVLVGLGMVWPVWLRRPQSLTEVGWLFLVSGVIVGAIAAAPLWVAGGILGGVAGYVMGGISLRRSHG